MRIAIIGAGSVGQASAQGWRLRATRARQARERCWIAELDGEPAGCIGLPQGGAVDPERLDAARHLYEAVGFKLAREEPHHSWGKDHIGQYWELKFKSGTASGQSLTISRV